MTRLVFGGCWWPCKVLIFPDIEAYYRGVGFAKKIVNRVRILQVMPLSLPDLRRIGDQYLNLMLYTKKSRLLPVINEPQRCRCRRRKKVGFVKNRSQSVTFAAKPMAGRSFGIARVQRLGGRGWALNAVNFKSVLPNSTASCEKKGR
jgi:hypothetical protein